VNRFGHTERQEHLVVTPSLALWKGKWHVIFGRRKTVSGSLPPLKSAEKNEFGFRGDLNISGIVGPMQCLNKPWVPSGTNRFGSMSLFT
jgi:hypothetical protein